MKDRSERRTGHFSPDNIANYKTLSHRFFADYGTEALFEQNEKNQFRLIVFLTIKTNWFFEVL